MEMVKSGNTESVHCKILVIIYLKHYHFVQRIGYIYFVTFVICKKTVCSIFYSKVNNRLCINLICKQFDISELSQSEFA